ncbi:MAG: hypothetical protein AB8F65_14630 [Woeseiaceae bacterium]
MSFFAELARRNVLRVGAAYVVVSWVVAQVAEFAFENFGAPDWVLKSFIVVLLLGLPFALFFAWAFEMTPDGVKREEDVDRSDSATKTTRRKLDLILTGGLLVALGYFIWERQAGDIDDAVSPDAVAVATDSLASTESAEVDAITKSVAVLPFVNLSSDEDNAWFSDGLTEEILNALARTPDLLVAGRTSSFPYKNSTKGVSEIAKALGVDHILEGSVRRANDQLRVTAQLIRASDGFQLWSQTYDRKPDDVIAIQEDIALEIATALETAMDPEALASMLSAGTDSVAAYNAYLEGQAIGANTVSTGNQYQFVQALESYEKAITLDPEFATAYWALADFWYIQLQSTNIVSGLMDMDREELRLRFEDAIEKAIRFERDEISKTKYRTFAAMQERRYPLALRLNTQYLLQRPNDQRAQRIQLNLLVDQSMNAELLAAIRAFEQRDGYDTIVINESLTFLLTSDDQEYQRDFARRALERAGDSVFVLYQAHRTLLWAGDLDGASRLLPMLLSSNLPDTSRLLVELRQACAENNTTAAERHYKRLRESAEAETSENWLAHTIMGRLDDARDVLMPLDAPDQLDDLTNYLSYAFFDARLYPNLMALLESQGIEPRQPKEIPYRCETT